MAALVSFKGTRPSAFRGRLSLEEGDLGASSHCCFVPPAAKNCNSQVSAGKGPQPRQVLGQEAHPGPTARSEHPSKGLPDNTAIREVQGIFLMWLFLGLAIRA